MSSSSSSYADTANPDSSLRRLVTLIVQHRDNSEEVIPAGGVILEAGTNIQLVLPNDSDEVTVIAGEGIGIENKYYSQKYTALIALDDAHSSGNPLSGPYPDPDTGIIPEGPAWSFTTESLWFGTINDIQAEPITGAFFIVPEVCGNVGTLHMHDSAFPITPPLGAGVLNIVDVCIPCVDCRTFQRINMFLSRLVDCYDYLATLALNTDTTTPPVPPAGMPDIATGDNGVLVQLLSSMRFWDYLVHQSAVKLNTQAQGQNIVTSVYYKNISNFALPSSGGGNPTCTLTYTFYETVGGSTSPFDCLSASWIDIKVLERTGVTNFTWVSETITSSVITVVLDCAALASGEAAFGDVAILFKNMILFDNPAASYTATVDMILTNNHLGEPVSRQQIVYFKPPDTAST